VGRIVPVIVEPVTLPLLCAPLIHLDLTGLDEAAAAARLRTGLGAGNCTKASTCWPRTHATCAKTPSRAGAQVAHLVGISTLPTNSRRTDRHRLNRGGDRQANAAIHRIVV
jgi:hypothetical protein